MTKIVVVSAPRSGTHMLCRMISRAGKLPWKVPLQVKQIEKIKEPRFVVGVHDTWESLQGDGLTLVGLRRNQDSHAASLSKIKSNRASWLRIVESLPEESTVNYDLLILNDFNEILKLRKITGLFNLEYEAWENRYSGPFDWCRKAESVTV